MSPWLFLVLLPGCAGQGQAAAPGPATRVRGEVVDAATGRPIPCRVSIRGEDGSWHFPESGVARGLGRRVPQGRRSATPTVVEMHTTLSAHPFVVRLPPGRYTLTVERGKEYHPETSGGHGRRRAGRADRSGSAAGSTWPARGWYSGDTHVHRTLDELPNVMLAEDLNVAFPLTDWVREAFVPPVERRAGRRSATPAPTRSGSTRRT